MRGVGFEPHHTGLRYVTVPFGKSYAYEIHVR